MINGPHSASMLPKPPVCSCMESRAAPGCIGAGGRGAPKDGAFSGGVVADAIPPLDAAAAAPVAAVFGTVSAPAPAAVEALAESAPDAVAAVLPEAGFSRFAAVFAVFFVVRAAEAVFFVVFFCPAFFAIFFATFFAAFFAAARMPPLTGPRASRSGSRAESFALLSSVIARSPIRCRDATTPIERPPRPGSAAASSATRASSMIARAKWMPPLLP